jgi:hypothetical protein
MIPKNERAHTPFETVSLKSYNTRNHGVHGSSPLVEPSVYRTAFARQTMENVAACQGQFPPGSLALIEVDKVPFIEESLFGKIIYADFDNHSIGRKVPYREGSLQGILAVTDSRMSPMPSENARCIPHLMMIAQSNLNYPL